MRGLMMDYQLTLPTLMRRAETYFAGKEIVSRVGDGSFHRTNYRDLMRRSRQLGVALQITAKIPLTCLDAFGLILPTGAVPSALSSLLSPGTVER